MLNSNVWHGNIPCWRVVTRMKQLSITAIAVVIWLQSTYVKYWPCCRVAFWWILEAFRKCYRQTMLHKRIYLFDSRKKLAKELLIYFDHLSRVNCLRVTYFFDRMTKRNGLNFKKESGNFNPSNELRGSVWERRQKQWVWVCWQLGVAHRLECHLLSDNKLDLLWILHGR